MQLVERELTRLRCDLAALKVSVLLLRISLLEKHAFDPAQPRHPPGSSDGGRWSGGAAGGGRLAQNIPRGPGSRTRVGGRWVDATPAQEARLAATRAQADAAVRKVREREPKWRPAPGLYENIEGEIAANEVIVREANMRLTEQIRIGIGPGAFDRQSIVARGSGQSFTSEERAAINRIGREHGCHTCGTKDPGSFLGNFVPDHQLPTAINPAGRPQRLHLQCLSCSRDQGLWISRSRRDFP